MWWGWCYSVIYVVDEERKSGGKRRERKGEKRRKKKKKKNDTEVTKGDWLISSKILLACLIVHEKWLRYIPVLGREKGMKNPLSSLRGAAISRAPPEWCRIIFVTPSVPLGSGLTANMDSGEGKKKLVKKKREREREREKMMKMMKWNGLHFPSSISIYLFLYPSLSLPLHPIQDAFLLMPVDP